jgi:hypothetical protein
MNDNGAGGAQYFASLLLNFGKPALEIKRVKLDL